MRDDVDREATRSADADTEAPGPERVRRDGSPIRDPERYEILGEHGRGGLGRVSRAHDKDFGRDIAIKELLSRGHINEQRFVREAMITARLEHPGIVPVYEAGRWPDGTPFYAMKLVSGRPLRALIAERTTVDERIGLLHHVIAVADAMAYAHGRNVIHRDLKPANVIVGDFGETVVIDWGLAKDLTASDELPRGSGSLNVPEGDLTSTGSVLGTRAYMAPEQERGEAVDQRADVFAIGAMLWELCSLQKVPPADRRQRHRLLRGAGIDPDLITIVDKALEPDAERRYADAGALAADLKAFKSGARIAARSYTLWAMLAHWTRRHRALATAIVVAVVLLAAGGTVSVRNIATERDRVDAALTIARQERDRSRLSEAALSLDKDPNHAVEVLASFKTRTPQVAMLASRAHGLSATKVIGLSATIGRLTRARDGASVEVLAFGGTIERLDPSTGAIRVLDHDVLTAPAYRGDALVYAKQIDDKTVQIAGAGDPVTIASSAGAGIAQVVALHDVIYFLDAGGDLHRVAGRATAVVAHGIHRIAGDGGVLLVCHKSSELEIHDHGTVLRRRCQTTKTIPGMMVVGDDYAAIGDDGTLLMGHAGALRELPSEVRGEYELALSESGGVVIAGYGANGGTWFVRPGGTKVEPVPTRNGEPWGVGAGGSLVAWGYTDGTVLVQDVLNGARWELHGHTGPVGYLVIDAGRGRIISESRRELRVWDIKTVDSTQIATMPCSVFHIQPSPDGAEVALDCSYGGVWVWSRPTGALKCIDLHDGLSFELQWVRGKVCSGGGGDGQVRCSRADGADPEVFDLHTQVASWMTVTPDREALIVASFEGTVWRLDSELHALYSHHERPNQTAVSETGRLLGSCARDGSIAVYDLTAHRLIAMRFAHGGAFCNVGWVGEELWSSGDDGTLKTWQVRDGELRLAHQVQVAGPIRSMKVAPGMWAAVENPGTILVSQDGATITLRIETGGVITALGVSPERRYVVASVDHELIVIDLQHDAVAAVAMGVPVRQFAFLEPGVLAFSEPAALKTLRLDQLAYERFERTPEPRNRVSF